MNIIGLIATRALGVVTLIIGILGLALPVIPGWILIFVGLNLLGIDILLIKNYLEKRKEAKTNKRKAS